MSLPTLLLFLAGGIRCIILARVARLHGVAGLVCRAAPIAVDIKLEKHVEVNQAIDSATER